MQPQERRCLNCNKMLLKGHIITVQIKCPRCGTINNLSASERHNGGYHAEKRFPEIKSA